jgi:hypothetical protein
MYYYMLQLRVRRGARSVGGAGELRVGSPGLAHGHLPGSQKPARGVWRGEGRPERNRERGPRGVCCVCCLVVLLVVVVS